jgi:two-component system, cell cycle sensor histidine kinase and response regulator CckA
VVINATPEFEPGEPSPYRVAVTMHDITERKQAADALGKSEELYRLLFMNSADGILRVALDGRILDCNRSACRSLGYSQEELSSLSIQDIDASWTESRVKETAARQLALGEPSNHVSVQRRKDGTSFPVEVRSQITTIDGTSQYIVTLRDTTERSRLERAVRLQAEAATIMAEGVNVVRLGDELITYANPTFEAMFGYERGELLGQHVSVLNAPESDGYTSPVGEIQDALETTGIWKGEILNQRKDGTLFWSGASCSAIDHPEHGAVAVSVHSDITERKRAEEELKVSRSQLMQARKLESLGLLAGGVAHDFNNLLTPILIHADRGMRKLPPDDPLRLNLDGIKQAGQRARDLTRQLLAFSGKQVLDIESVNLGDVVGTYRQTLRRLVREDIEMVFQHVPTTNHIDADTTRLGQVLLNLAANAQDAMPDGGRVVFETREVTLATERVLRGGACKAGRYLLLRVHDTGEGMAPDTLDHLFDPFFTTKERGKGVGLGLATVHGVVAQHGGCIDVRSTPGEGTTFELYFPTTESTPIGQAPDEESDEYSELGTETVLLVEDEPVVRELACSALSELGYQVIEAADGEHALRRTALHEGPIDLLLTDVVMPRLGGWELYERLSVIRPGLRVVFMSGYADGRLDRNELARIGAAFVAKPFSAGSLTRAVRMTLDLERDDPSA